MQPKPVRQRRSKDKRDRILKAMDALLQRKPFASIGVADLAARAKVAPATIYQRFSNVDATASVLLHLYFLKVEQWARRPRATSAREAESLRAALRAIAADGYDQVAELGYVMRPAYLYSRQHPDRVGPEWSRLEATALEGFRAFLEKWSSEIRVRDRARAAELVCHLFNFMLLGPLLHGEEPHAQHLRGREPFADALADLAHRYLTYAE